MECPSRPPARLAPPGSNGASPGRHPFGRSRTIDRPRDRTARANGAFNSTDDKPVRRGMPRAWRFGTGPCPTGLATRFSPGHDAPPRGRPQKERSPLVMARFRRGGRAWSVHRSRRITAAESGTVRTRPLIPRACGAGWGPVNAQAAPCGPQEAPTRSSPQDWQQHHTRSTRPPQTITQNMFTTIQRRVPLAEVRLRDGGGGQE